MENIINEPVHSGFWANIFKSPKKKNELQNIILSLLPFNHLSNKDFSLLLNIVHNRSYVQGEIIFKQNDPGIGFYIILDGIVVIEKEISPELKIRVSNLSKGDFFGELALVDDERRSANAIAETDVKIAVIFKHDLEEFINRYPKKGLKILQGLNTIITIRLRNLDDDNFNLQKKLNYYKEKENESFNKKSSYSD